MGMKPYRRAVAVTGKYTDRDGKEKSRYQNVGTLFQGDGEDQGRFSLKMEALPLGDWNGWISFFEIEDRREGSGQSQQRSSGGGDYAGASGRDSSGPRENFNRDDLDGDAIPFISSESLW